MSSVLAECLRLLDNPKLKNLLLNGIELSNTFLLNPKMSDIFIEGQHTLRKKQAAEVLIKTNEYITHLRFIQNCRKIIDLFFQRIQGKPYIIDTESKTKSGFFCTMIFLFIIKYSIDNYDSETSEVCCLYYLPKDIIIDLYDKNTDIVVTDDDIYIMQVNDMDYSANQLSHMVPKDYDNYIVLRAFTNSYALQQKHVAKLVKKNNYIYGEIIPTFKEKLLLLYNTNKIKYSKIDEIDKVYNDVFSFFAGCSSSEPGIMNVYLDHKVADWGSTISLALTIGIIPNNTAYLGDTDHVCVHTGIPSLYLKENPDENETLKQPSQYIVPLINNCDYYSIKDNYSGNYNKIRNDFDDDLIQRCPFSWYKNVNYQTGDLDLTNTRNTLDKLESPLLWEPPIPDEDEGKRKDEIIEITINNNNTDKLNKITEIINQLKIVQIRELYNYVLSSSIVGTKMFIINKFINQIKDKEDLLTKTLTWDKLKEYLYIKINLIGGRTKIKSISKRNKTSKRNKRNKSKTK